MGAGACDESEYGSVRFAREALKEGFVRQPSFRKGCLCDACAAGGYAG